MTTAEIVPASGLPAALVTLIDHGQRSFTFGVCLVAVNTTLKAGAAPAASGKARRTRTSAASRSLTPQMLFLSELTSE